MSVERKPTGVVSYCIFNDKIKTIEMHRVLFSQQSDDTRYKKKKKEKKRVGGWVGGVFGLCVCVYRHINQNSKTSVRFYTEILSRHNPCHGIHSASCVGLSCLDSTGTLDLSSSKRREGMTFAQRLILLRVERLALQVDVAKL